MEGSRIPLKFSVRLSGTSSGGGTGLVVSGLGGKISGCGTGFTFGTSVGHEGSGLGGISGTVGTSGGRGSGFCGIRGSGG